MKVRPTFRDLMIWTACTGPTTAGAHNSIEPFARYIADEGVLTPWLRNWHIKMLKAEESEQHYFEYRRRVGRPTTRLLTPLDPSDSDAALMFACAETDSIAPFTSYLAEGAELTNPLRNWWVSMLRHENVQSHHLHYVARGWSQSLEEIFEELDVETRADELRSVVITDEFVASLLNTYDLEEAPPEELNGRRIYRLGRLALGYDWDDTWIKPDLTLEVGKFLNESQVRFLLRCETGRSPSTLKRLAVKFRKAREIE